MSPPRHVRSLATAGILLLAGASPGTAQSVLLPTAPAQPVVAKPKLSPLAPQPDWKQLGRFSGALTEEEFTAAFSQIYSDGSAFPPPWRIEDNALLVDTTPGQPPVRIAFRKHDEKAQKPQRYWRTPQELAPLQPGEPVLKGLHIALDPGHIGGSWAEIEERWLSMEPGGVVMEGSLVLQVARLLKPRLEALGAQVSLVRSEESPLSPVRPNDLKNAAREFLISSGIPQPQESYTDRSDDKRILTVQWQAEKLFYRISEIRARAKRVNEELRPDLVLCLHLNAEAWGDPKNPSFVDRNHFHLLINGCYSPEELLTEDVRHEMLQRLFTRAHEQELAASGPASDAMMHATALPPYVYTNASARRVSGNPAVLARNLLASRLYQCPVLYFEPYVMNHEMTYRRLVLGHYIGRTLVNGQLVTSPLEDYTRGVVQGLKDHYTKARGAAAP